MAIIKIKRGASVPTGLTAGELAWNYLNSNLFIGATGSQIIRIAGSNSVQTFNGLSGAVSGVTTSVANTFTPLQTFNSGISASGGTFATDIVVNGVIVGRGAGSATTNTAVGNGALTSNTTGVQNGAFGTQALSACSTGSSNIGIGRRALNQLTNGGNNVVIGSNAAISFNGNNLVAVGSNCVGSLTTGTGGIYIGNGSDSSGSDRTNEIVIGSSIAGLGSNTTLIGPSTQTLARINGLLDVPSGISSAGATFSALTTFNSGISAAGGTFTNISIRNSSNSLTTTITAPSTSGTAKSITLPNRSGTIALEHSSGPIISDAGGDIIINPFGMTINNLPTVTDLGVMGNTAYMLHLNPFEIPKGCTLTRVVAIQGAPCTGHTGSMIFAVYDTGLTNGLPNNLIYSSASVQITKTDYQRYTATPNVNLTAGSYWIGYLMDRTGVTGNMSWGTVSGKAQSWDAFSNGGRFFNSGQMATIRYRLSGFTLASQLTAGFTSGVASGSNPAIGYGNSETYYDNKSPWVGISVQQ
jgi:hypothetical protein